MSFAVIFDNEHKTIERCSPSKISVDDLPKARFAWIDLEWSERSEVEGLLQHFGIEPQELEKLIDPRHPYFFKHRQKLIINVHWVCSHVGDDIVTSPILVVMTDRVIVTAHDPGSEYIQSVLATYEDSFKSVGKSPGFIYFLLWDAIVDGFLPQIFYVDNRLEQLEELYLDQSQKQHDLTEVIRYKHMARTFKQSLAPMQRSLRHLVNTKLELISEESKQYLRGLYEHLDRLSMSIDSLQERVHSAIEIYNSILSKQINQSMKVLTVIATIMMPLSLIAGIYGTNFVYIPELNWRYGYFVFLGVLVVVGVTMLVIFKKKRWL